MNIDRINGFISISKKDIVYLIKRFDSSLEIIDFSRINEGMSNTGYKVTTQSGEFLLKIYSNSSDRIETVMYTYLKDIINVPELYYYDGGKQFFQFSYTVTKFIEGVTLIKYLRSRSHYPPEIARKIGSMCAMIHKREYPHDAMLDENLNISRVLPYTREKISLLLANKPAAYLKRETVNKLNAFINNNPKLFEKIKAESVLCHGDFSYGNIMVSGEKVYCIDFEYAYSGSRYHDIGHFFRRKDDNIRFLIDDRIYNAFSDGYNSVSEKHLPLDWSELAHICDINAMLCLLTRDCVPHEWINDIEFDILNTIS